MKYYLFAHNSKHFVNKGDKVKAYDKWIGEIGNADGVYYAHLHFSISEGLTQSQLRSYINGWSVNQVKKYYSEPKVDRTKMFSDPVDNGERGYGWLQRIANGSPHPGIDYNGLKGGNTDYGYKFRSPVDGEVIFAGDWRNGWGKVIIIQEITNKKEPMNENETKLLKFIKEKILNWGPRLNSSERKKTEKIITTLKEDNELMQLQIKELTEENFILNQGKIAREVAKAKETKSTTILQKIKSLLNIK